MIDGTRWDGTTFRLSSITSCKRRDARSSSTSGTQWDALCSSFACRPDRSTTIRLKLCSAWARQFPSLTSRVQRSGWWPPWSNSLRYVVNIPCGTMQTSEIRSAFALESHQAHVPYAANARPFLERHTPQSAADHILSGKSAESIAVSQHPFLHHWARHAERGSCKYFYDL